MDIRQLAAVTVLLGAGAAAAVPRISDSDPKEGPREPWKAVLKADNKEIAGVQAQLLTLAAVSQHDTSTPLKRFSPHKLQAFTAEEQFALNKAIGRCNCSVTLDEQVADNSTDCTIAGTSGTNMVVLTVGHLIRDVLSPIGAAPESLHCQFANNFGDAPVPLSLEFGTFRIGSLYKTEKANDRLAIALKYPIDHAIEIPVLTVGRTFSKGAAIYAVSAGLRERVGGRDLVAQECTVYESSASRLLTDCTSIKGQGSGMPNLLRDEQGRLVLVGITQGSSLPDKDGEPAIVISADGKISLNNLTRSVTMRSAAVEDLLKVEREVLRDRRRANGTTGQQ
ncbi:hypothetical protein [Mesorhizobium sp. M2A.F.Ca.ET.039.01.1.1]|uniref:hypothetical protein n=1 Tax=Mesorhizobium sp. M2A.F.Ca.ET.039.01.1.1 TaxID=2496746 RepID=UPI000FCCBF4F|nr:hypothetical protein [Mesorhizobium sp. M2A.F.Ca.ET.039.01.1.1]RWX63149.1 hypothetical protein EOA24_26070 [Mesorhizobium sp. M2A.F.Ca.ET.039.01.1.1]